MLFDKAPFKMWNLRPDSLAIMMCSANVGAHSRVLVIEACQGLIAAAAAQRMGGCGVLCACSSGDKPAPMDCVRYMNFSEEQRQVICTTSLPALQAAKAKAASEQPAQPQPGGAGGADGAGPSGAGEAAAAAAPDEGAAAVDGAEAMAVDEGGQEAGSAAADAAAASSAPDPPPEPDADEAAEGQAQQAGQQQQPQQQHRRHTYTCSPEQLQQLVQPGGQAALYSCSPASWL